MISEIASTKILLASLYYFVYASFSSSWNQGHLILIKLRISSYGEARFINFVLQIHLFERSLLSTSSRVLMTSLLYGISNYRLVIVIGLRQHLHPSMRIPLNTLSRALWSLNWDSRCIFWREHSLQI